MRVGYETLTLQLIQWTKRKTGYEVHSQNLANHGCYIYWSVFDVWSVCIYKVGDGVMRNPFNHLKYGTELFSLCEALMEPWMTETEKIEFAVMTLQSKGNTLEELNEQIVIGVENGYPADLQVLLAKLAVLGTTDVGPDKIH